MLRKIIETSVEEGKTPGLAGSPKTGLTNFDGVVDTPSKQMQNKTGTPLGLRGTEEQGVKLTAQQQEVHRSRIYLAQERDINQRKRG